MSCSCRHRASNITSNQQLCKKLHPVLYSKKRLQLSNTRGKKTVLATKWSATESGSVTLCICRYGFRKPSHSTCCLAALERDGRRNVQPFCGLAACREAEGVVVAWEKGWDGLGGLFKGLIASISSLPLKAVCIVRQSCRRVHSIGKLAPDIPPAHEQVVRAAGLV